MLALKVATASCAAACFTKISADSMRAVLDLGAAPWVAACLAKPSTSLLDRQSPAVTTCGWTC